MQKKLTFFDISRIYHREMLKVAFVLMEKALPVTLDQHCPLKIRLVISSLNIDGTGRSLFGPLLFSAKSFSAQFCCSETEVIRRPFYFFLQYYVVFPQMG